MRRVADQREPVGHEGARDLHVERKGLARAGERDLAEPRAEALGELGEEAGFVHSHDGLAARSRSSVHTIEDRLPVSGRMANGPEGRKCCTALP